MLILPQFLKSWGIDAMNTQRTLDLESESLRKPPTRYTNMSSFESQFYVKACIMPID